MSNVGTGSSVFTPMLVIETMTDLRHILGILSLAKPLGERLL